MPIYLTSKRTWRSSREVVLCSRSQEVPRTWMTELSTTTIRLSSFLSPQQTYKIFLCNGTHQMINWTRRVKSRRRTRRVRSRRRTPLQISSKSNIEAGNKSQCRPKLRHKGIGSPCVTGWLTDKNCRSRSWKSIMTCLLSSKQLTTPPSFPRSIYPNNHLRQISLRRSR